MQTGSLNRALRPQALALITMLALAACTGGGEGTRENPNPPPPPPPPPPSTSGLDARPNNTSCVAPDRSGGSVSYAVEDAFPGLPNIGQPVKLLVEPVADPRWFVLRKTGQLVVFDPDNATSVETFIDLSAVVRTNSEGGLLGMVFHPDYPATPEIFLYYTIDGSSTEMQTIVSRFILDDIDNPQSPTEQIILEVDQFASNHNGGDIAFGADRLLYIGLGDGGGGGDPQETGQDTTRLLGAFLRLDVIGTGTGYTIPPSNPFAGNAQCGPDTNADDCPEIYAWGLRNPWRWSFDPPTGVLWAGDVGQGAREEIDQIVLGGNYGWDCREGTATFESSGCSGPFVDPVSEYSHSNGNRSITGGFVYRGSALTSLIGRYVFADFASGRLWALADDGSGGFTNEELLSSGTSPSAFGVDENNELFYADYSGGRLMRLTQSGGNSDPVPDQLSASGCVSSTDVTQPSDGLIAYDLNAPFWSDGAAKDRHMGLPNSTTIDIDTDDDWLFPNGTVIVKNFSLNGRLVETRHLMRHPDGGWAGYTYEWNAAQTEANRVRGGKTVTVEGQQWVFPNEAECLQCHTAVAGVALGPETAQLNGDVTYPTTGRTANQLETLDEISLFSTPLPADVSTLPVMPDPFDTSADLGERARAYLHTNCAQCHQPGGPTPVGIDLRYTTALADMDACDVVPTAGDLGIGMARLIAPGDASRSVVIARTAVRDDDAMPPLASLQVDTAGVALLTDWVDSLAACN